MRRDTYFQRLRQAYLAALCETVGSFNRADLVERFDISVPQASVDIRQFLADHPDVTYDKSAKCYRAAKIEAERGEKT